MRHIPPSTLVLSGGGIKGLAYVGAFIELENRKYLKTLNYPRPLREIEGNHFGISYEGKIYPIINSLSISEV